MRKIVLFRAPKEGDEEDPYEKVLSSIPCSVSSIPVLSFDFVNLDLMSMALANVEAYSGIIFTSRRAVEAVQSAASKLTEWLTILSKWRELAAFAVGQTTANMARDTGFTVMGEDAGNARNLAAIILEELPRDSKPLLYPCGNLKMETIPKIMKESGQALEEIMAYTTCQNPALEDLVCEYLEKEGAPTCVVYFSPSGVRYTFDILYKHGIELHNTQVVAIGPSTEKELEKYNISVHGTAIKPSPEDLFQAIIKGD